MTTGTPDDVRIAVSEEPEIDLSWLYEITEKPNPPKTPKPPPIQKVVQTLRRIGWNKRCFDPCVVSFGPWHRGKSHLVQMERDKEVAARWFISLGAGDNRKNAKEEAKRVYDEFVVNAPIVSSLRECYTHKFEHTINDADFMRMMFLDGCFILYFIQAFVDRSDLSETSRHTRPLILRDMFLLENQIPYSVLVALKKLKPSLMPGKRIDDWIVSFFETVFLPPPSTVVSYSLLVSLTFLFLMCTVLPVFFVWLIICVIVRLLSGLVYLLYRLVSCLICCRRRSADSCYSCFEDSSTHSRSEEVTEPAEPKHLHLLDLLRSELTGKGVGPPVHGAPHRNYNCRPISELKAAGILVRASESESLSLNNIKLEEGLIIYSYLELPRIIIDDSTKTHLLNLAAYEMCPDGSLVQPVITSYICFLNSLICNADDVKELRSSGIMLNRLGRDEEVVNLFRKLATDLSPDFNAYSHVTDGMEKHSRRCCNRPRMWIGQFRRFYFSGSWTAISSIAASSVIFLTLVQTIYSVLSYHKSP